MVYSTRRFVLRLAFCYFVLVFFRPFSISITLLGDERANLSAFRTSVRFALVWFCLFPLHLGVWEELRLEIYSVRLKTLLQQGISEPEFYGDLVYRFRKIVGKSNFSKQFRKLIKLCLRLGPPWFSYWFSLTLAYSRISHECSSLFIIMINLIFMFSL